MLISYISLKKKKRSQAVLPYFKNSFQSTSVYIVTVTSQTGNGDILGSRMTKKIMGSVLPINLDKNMTQGPAQAVPPLNL